ncbi:histidine N-acetyltransferase-like [Anabas testudineus]|uniref:N-acetyltransferase domain-containing protein n=1 Tax=Anabas testudineus TaxID=64144 RepID=A0A3Q1JDA0_ANATE|nr:histidine N-acetyltransferase-like [Anabas testudineus]
MCAAVGDMEYRLAEEQDFSQVMNICSKDDYSGLDYMAASFHSWLQEPGRLVFIAKMKDRVVALESALLVDGGETVVFQGLRVTSDLRGHSIGGALQKHVTDYIRHHHPEVRTVRRSRGDQPSAQTLTKYRLTAKEAIVSLCCESTNLGPFITELRSKLLVQTNSRGPVTLNQQQADALILTDHVVSNLLPGQTMINNWEPLKPMEANLEVLHRRNLMWIADREVEPTAVSLCTPPYSVPYRHDALRININIFGQSLPSVCSVFLAQLEALLPSLHGYLIFLIFVHPELWPGLRQFCQNKADVSFFKDYWEVVFLEADF